MKRLAFTSLAAAALVTGAAAAAPAPAPPPAPQPAPAPAARKRDVPDYDGRPPPPPTAREAFMWIPRAILLPAHLTAEYVLRRPVVGFVRWGDEHYVFKRIYDFFTWDGGQSGVYPIANLDLGLKNTVGLALVDRSFFAPENSIRVSWSVSTQGVFTIAAQNRLEVFRDGTGTLSWGGHFVQRPDGVFYGLGPDTHAGDKTFYSYQSRGGALGLSGKLGGLNRAVVDVGYRDAHFGPSQISDQTPSLDARHGGVDQGPLPAGWGGYDLAWTRAALMLDSRHPSFESPGTGARLEVGSSYALSPRDRELQILPWGADAGIFFDLSGVRHVLALQVGAHFVERIGATAIPFPELPALGGNTWMRGFLAGRLRGTSTVAGTLEYRYPVGGLLEGELFSGLGNAFMGHLDGFAVRRLFLSSGVGLRTTFTRDASIALTVAIASNRLDSPDFHPFEERRVSVAVIHGF
jgi:hypothetical protein